MDYVKANTSIVAVKSFTSRRGGNYWKLGEPLVPSLMTYYYYENNMESLKIQEMLYAWLAVLKVLLFHVTIIGGGKGARGLKPPLF